MSYASAIPPLFVAEDLVPLRELGWVVLRAAAVLLQVAGFAGTMWLLLAAPGFLA